MEHGTARWRMTGWIRSKDEDRNSRGYISNSFTHKTFSTWLCPVASALQIIAHSLSKCNRKVPWVEKGTIFIKFMRYLKRDSSDDNENLTELVTLCEMVVEGFKELKLIDKPHKYYCYQIMPTCILCTGTWKAVSTWFIGMSKTGLVYHMQILREYSGEVSRLVFMNIMFLLYLMFYSLSFLNFFSLFSFIFLWVLFIFLFSLCLPSLLIV